MRFVLCADGSEQSKKALELIRDMYKADDELILLSVGNYEEHFWQEEAKREKQKRKAQQVAQVIVDSYVQLATGFNNVKTQVLVGSPRETIVQFAEDNNVDVIAMGARGLSAVQRLVVGSVSDYVMKNSTCTVLVSKQKN